MEYFYDVLHGGEHEHAGCQCLVLNACYGGHLDE